MDFALVYTCMFTLSLNYCPMYSKFCTNRFRIRIVSWTVVLLDLEPCTWTGIMGLKSGYWTLDSDLLHLQPVTDRFEPPVRRHPDWDVIRTGTSSGREPAATTSSTPGVPVSATRWSGSASRFDVVADSGRRLISGVFQGQLTRFQTSPITTGLTQT